MCESPTTLISRCHRPLVSLALLSQFCCRALPFACSWKELSGADLQQAVKAFGEEKPSSGDDAQEEGAPVSGVPNVRKEERERLGARYFAGVLKTKKGRGKERNIEIQVEVRCTPAQHLCDLSLKTAARHGKFSFFRRVGRAHDMTEQRY